MLPKRSSFDGQKYYIAYFFLCVVVLFTTESRAALITVPLSGKLAFAAPSNPFGVSPEDGFTGIAIFDDAIIPSSGSFLLGVDTDPSFHLTIALGSRSFTETEDADFGTGLPQLRFEEGSLVGLDFAVPFAEVGYPNLSLEIFGPLLSVTDTDAGSLLVTGQLIFSPVPEPSILADLLIAFVALLGLIAAKHVRHTVAEK
jgi:hypothetical protein